MYIVAGLGNPGKDYEMTRHNIGFHFIDYIADKYSVKVNKLKFKGLFFTSLAKKTLVKCFSAGKRVRTT